MTRTSKEIKRIARDMLNNRYQIPMGAFVIAGLVPAMLEIPFSMSVGEVPTRTQLIILGIAEFLIFLISGLFHIGIVRLHLNLTRGHSFRLSDLLTPFRQRTERFLGAALLLGLPVPACGVLIYAAADRIRQTETDSASVAVLVGVCALSLVGVLCFLIHYLFAVFFLLDDPDCSVRAAFRASRRLVRGRRFRLLYLLFSFLGWGMLILFSFGIAALWIAPYFTQTLVTFYLDCTDELNRIPVRSYRQASPTL